jgi:hypothetical protein
MTYTNPSYILCPGCEENLILPTNAVGLCTPCRKRAEGKGVRISGQGIKVRLQKVKIPCRICHKLFYLHVLQDPRYTWYCPKCRKHMEPITSGLNWLHRIGVDVQDGDQLKSTGEPSETGLIEDIDYFGGGDT